MNIRLLVGALVIAGLGASQGCASTPDQGGTQEPELGAVPTITRKAEISYPLDAYRMTPEQRLSLGRAEDLLLRDCLSRFGFAYELPSRVAESYPDDAIGIVEESEVVQYGYKNHPIQQQAKRVEQEKAKETPMPPAMVGVISGQGPTRMGGEAVPEGGCSGEARRALGVTEKSQATGDENFIIRLAAQSSHQAEADSRLKDAFAKWSGCMKEAGYFYSDPWGPNDDPAFATETASPNELATAKTDLACRIRFNVNGVWVAVRSAYQSRLIEQNAEALRQHKTLMDERLRKAAEIVASSR